MPVVDSILRHYCTFGRLGAPLCRVTAMSALALLYSYTAPASAQSCPALQPYYPAHSPATPEEWAAKLPALEALLESCLLSDEYFAVLGAAQLNTGQVPQSLESLERALLTNPQNGAAQIDYAETLFLSGQLFAAIQINDALLRRQDLPENLQPMLLARRRLWQQQTLQHELMLEVTTGVDDNLNGAPMHSDLTITYGGTPVLFSLSPDNRPVRGAFAGLQLGGAWQFQRADYRHELVATVRVRKAPGTQADQVQGDWQYTFMVPVRHNQWELGAGTSHMMFRGSPLYSIGGVRARYVWGASECKPSLEGGAKQLHSHAQGIMDGTETSVTAGIGCSFAPSRQGVRLDAGVLDNRAQDPARPGGDRTGWNVRLNWQWQVGPSEFGAQLGYTSLDDGRGYSPLLDNDAVRSVQSQYLNLRYRRKFDSGLSLLVKLTHQQQHSNLVPFQNRGAVYEVGLTTNF